MILSDEQFRAAHAPERDVMIVAGAGTGKTRTLIARAAQAVAAGPLPVVLCAFTRAAAAELGQRTEAMGLDVHCTTLHALAAEILRDAGVQFSIIDDVEDARLQREPEAAATVRERDGLLRYGDLIPRAMDVHRKPIGHLLVDEAHDLDGVQWSFIRALDADYLTIVLDPAQRIYGWRGAIDPPAGFCDRAARYDLTGNYRSSRAVCALANRLSIRGRLTLRPMTTDRGIAFQEPSVFDDDEHAVANLASIIRTPSAWAILTRTRSRAAVVATHLRAMGIPVHAPVLQRAIWDRPEGRAALDLLHTVVDPHSSRHLRRLLEAAGTPRSVLLRLDYVRTGRACSLWDALTDSLATKNAPDVVWILARHILRAHQDGWTVRDLADHVPPLFLHADAVDAVADLTAAEALAWVADPDALPSSSQGDRVWVGTVHASKGLEWPHVVVYGLEEGSMPVTRQGADLDEERRVLYVAITRARESVQLVRCARRTMPHGHRLDASPSRFLEELR